jgi:hypothetical protein
MGVALKLGQVFVLLADVMWLQFPALTCNLGDNLVVGDSDELLGSF